MDTYWSGILIAVGISAAILVLALGALGFVWPVWYNIAGKGTPGKYTTSIYPSEGADIDSSTNVSVSAYELGRYNPAEPNTWLTFYQPEAEESRRWVEDTQGWQVLSNNGYMEFSTTEEELYLEIQVNWFIESCLDANGNPSDSSKGDILFALFMQTENDGVWSPDFVTDHGGIIDFQLWPMTTQYVHSGNNEVSIQPGPQTCNVLLTKERNNLLAKNTKYRIFPACASTFGKVRYDGYFQVKFGRNNPYAPWPGLVIRLAPTPVPGHVRQA